MGYAAAASEGRAEAIGRAVRALGEGRGVLVVAERGAGRTHFVQSLLAELDPRLREQIWLGEDVQRLDEVRSARLAAAVRDRRALPVMTAASRRPLGALVDGLLRGGSVERIDLAPLDAGGMLRAVENFLGGPLDPEAVPVFVPVRPGGDLVVLQEAVRTAHAAGSLALREGRWQLVGPIPTQDALGQMIHARLSALSDSVATTGTATTILELLAIVPGISLPRLEVLLARLGGGDAALALEQLEDDCVIDVVVDRSELRLRVHDPVIELVLPQTIGILREGRIADALVDVLGGTPAHELAAGELMVLTRQALARGRSVESATLTRAARDALQAYRPELALQLATAAATGGGGFDAEVVIAAADAQLGRPEQSRDRLDAAQARNDLDETQRQLLVELARLVRHRLDDAVSRWNLPTGTRIAPDVFVSHRGIRGSIGQFTVHPALPLTRAGNDQGATPEARPPIDPTPVIEGERLRATASAAAMRGDLTGARRALDEAEAVLAPLGVDLFRVHWTRAFVEGYDRPLQESIDVVTRYRDGGAAVSHGVHQAMCTYLRGAFLVMAGRAAEAETELRAAMALYERNGMEVVAMHARPVLATALALRAEPAVAEVTLGPALAADRDPFLNGQIREAQAWIHVARGESAAAAAVFVEAADAHESDGFDLEALVALIGSARSGAAASVLARVDTLAERVEGVCVAVHVRLARALARVEMLGDAAGEADVQRAAAARELDATGAEAARLGFHGIAAEAYAGAARLHAQGGDERASVSSDRRVDAQVAASGLPELLLVQTRSGLVMSTREEEIAALAAAGRSNREIAEQLVLSVRTIETHLLRIYRKLGIRDRSSLACALDRAERPGASGPAGAASRAANAEDAGLD